MTTLPAHHLYHQALAHWGTEAQLSMLIEEMSELTTTICHLLRNRIASDSDAIIDELADVQIMLRQVIFALQLQSSVDLRIQVKLQRLEQRLGGV